MKNYRLSNSRRKYILLFGLLFAMSVANGQIKIVGEDTAKRTDLQTLLDIRKSNPVGLKFYIAQPNDCVQLCVNPSDSTVCFKQMQAGYYEISGIIRDAEQAGACFKNMLDFRITGSINYKKRLSAKYLQEFFSETRFPTTQEFEKYLLDDNSNLPDFIYVVTDNTGERFYIWSDGGPSTNQYGIEVKQGTFYNDYATWYINNPSNKALYETAMEKLKGKKVVIISNSYWGHIAKDASSGEWIENKNKFIEMFNGGEELSGLIRDRKQSPVVFTYDTCVDVFGKEEGVYGLFKRNDIQFELEINRVKEVSYGSIIAIMTQSDYEKYKEYYDLFRNLPCFSCNSNPIGGGNILIIPSDIIKQVQDADLALSNARKRDDEKRKALARAERERIEAENAARKEQRKQEILKKYGSHWGNLIINGKVAIGMTEEMCKDALGNPFDKYTETTAEGTTSVWIYNYKTALYFVEGKLVKIEN